MGVFRALSTTRKRPEVRASRKPKTPPLVRWAMLIACVCRIAPFVLFLSLVQCQRKFKSYKDTPHGRSGDTVSPTKPSDTNGLWTADKRV